MTKINSSKEGYFMAEKIPRSTVYRILKCNRKQVSGQTPKKMTKVQLNKLKKAFGSQRQHQSASSTQKI
ncbi:hypothetical protein BpHYR1_001022 [Brachionus plicatilis]|uniref:Uncharacterized protein n=1 Tax=Brachionus plicatilis TaxID=10195 RepID=A0A3M7T7V9_BRAPC|nr:hypothetical protein BpHYR1_001022 [Brachionus plicatilis]